MRGRGFRSLGVVLSAIAGTALLGVTSMMTSAFILGARTARPVMAEVALLDDESLIMGGSGVPIPPDTYVEAVNKLFIEPNHPGFTTNPLFTPEGFYPTAIKDLPFDTSVSRGVTILNDAITNEIADSNNIVVFGYSQSATISSLEMAQLADSGNPPSPEQLAFVLIGDPSNPNGGVLERFDGLTLPSFGLTYSGATADDLYPTDIYTLEYDGIADFPRYPIDILSDLNAMAGIYAVHGTYPELTSAQIDSAIPLKTVGDTMTTYYMIPTDTLPLLAPVQSIPVIGQPLYDLLEPDMEILVNLGYGSLEHGWSPGPANVPTEFGLWPTDISPAELFTALETGAQQGFTAFTDDLSNLSFSDLSDMFTPATDASDAPLPSFTDIVNAFTSAAATAYATLLPTADIANAFLATIPAYDASLFVDGLQSGSLLDAVGDPVAADLGLLSFAGAFELLVVRDAAQAIAGDLMGLIS